MKDFLIIHAAIIGTIVGVSIMLLMFFLLKYTANTKYSVIPEWYFIGLILIGVFHSSNTIVHWLLK